MRVAGRLVDDITLEVGPPTPVAVVLRVGFEATELDTVDTLATLDVIVGVSCGKFGVRILIFVVLSFAVENDFPNGIGLICRGAAPAPAVAVKGVATANRGPVVATDVVLNCVCARGCDVATFGEYTNVAWCGRGGKIVATSNKALTRRNANSYTHTSHGSCSNVSSWQISGLRGWPSYLPIARIEVAAAVLAVCDVFKAIGVPLAPLPPTLIALIAVTPPLVTKVPAPLAAAGVKLLKEIPLATFETAAAATASIVVVLICVILAATGFKANKFVTFVGFFNCMGGGANCELLDVVYMGGVGTSVGVVVVAALITINNIMEREDNLQYDDFIKNKTIKLHNIYLNPEILGLSRLSYSYQIPLCLEHPIYRI
uniref:Uncharacterized protein n=1 Tax=Glossina pallidipes TaxID=7398 RepID=A0A1A9ZS79_GLOPL